MAKCVKALCHLMSNLSDMIWCDGIMPRVLQMQYKTKLMGFNVVQWKVNFTLLRLLVKLIKEWNFHPQEFPIFRYFVPFRFRVKSCKIKTFHRMKSSQKVLIWDCWNVLTLYLSNTFHQSQNEMFHFRISLLIVVSSISIHFKSTTSLILSVRRSSVSVQSRVIYLIQQVTEKVLQIS